MICEAGEFAQKKKAGGARLIGLWRPDQDEWSQYNKSIPGSG
jgi:hypothetical protein